MNDDARGEKFAADYRALRRRLLDFHGAQAGTRGGLPAMHGRWISTSQLRAAGGPANAKVHSGSRGAI